VGRVEGDLAGVGVVVEEFGVAAPVDGGVELLLGVLGGEPAAERVEEERGAQKPAMSSPSTSSTLSPSAADSSIGIRLRPVKSELGKTLALICSHAAR
jgi:hypothetical protein